MEHLAERDKQRGCDSFDLESLLTASSFSARTQLVAGAESALNESSIFPEAGFHVSTSGRDLTRVEFKNPPQFSLIGCYKAIEIEMRIVF